MPQYRLQFRSIASSPSSAASNWAGHMVQYGIARHVTSRHGRAAAADGMVQSSGEARAVNEQFSRFYELDAMCLWKCANNWSNFQMEEILLCCQHNLLTDRHRHKHSRTHIVCQPIALHFTSWYWVQALADCSWLVLVPLLLFCYFAILLLLYAKRTHYFPCSIIIVFNFRGAIPSVCATLEARTKSQYLMIAEFLLLLPTEISLACTFDCGHSMYALCDWHYTFLYIYLYFASKFSRERKTLLSIQNAAMSISVNRGMALFVD